VVSATDPSGRILGFLDLSFCLNASCNIYKTGKIAVKFTNMAAEALFAKVGFVSLSHLLLCLSG
jgi:hypothetical protein